MPVRAAMRDIKEKRFAPIYVLYGAESYLKEEFIKLLRKEMVDPTYADLNYGVYDCAETPLEDIVVEANTLPFLADYRLLIADNAYFLTGAKPPSKVEHNIDSLMDYLQNPSPSSSLILHVQADKLDERKKLTKQLHQRALVLPFQPLRDQDLYAWVERTAKRYDAHIERENTMLLTDRLGNELRLLVKEIEKMSLYVKSGDKPGEITEETIRLLASRSLEQDVFSLVESVVLGKQQDAYRTMYDCFKMGEEPIKLLALLSRQFRMLLHVKMWAPRGYTQQQLATMLKVHPFAVKKAMEQAKHFSENSLRNLLAILAEEDFRMKSGQTDKRLALEMFISKVAMELNKVQ
ncbi:DNA polymerase III subunit delta [Brevibacillus daliensis]|uniref:DNA polymerase III subunit delta n=1 Tax=Brevibacillus daliensis TaxID=2892995 RepID=UPI001E36D952|nr:DNA polymerase III subunit delta [Brevibacillus daliensis]